MFNFSFQNIAKLLMPLSLRQTKMQSFISVCISQVEHLKLLFFTYRTDSLFLLAHNSQIIYLEHLLNYYFNPDKNLNDQNYHGNGIYITDANPGTETYLYNNGEQGVQIYLYNFVENASNTYLYNSVEFANRIGFIVNVPSSYNINIAELQGYVEKLKLAGKQFKIKMI